MFTQNQLEQLKKLFIENNELIKKTVREEITIEAIKTRQDGEQERIEILNSLSDISDELKDVRITSTKLEAGQNELSAGQDQLRNSVVELKVTVDKHTKTLQFMKKKVNRIDKTVEIIGRSYNLEIVANKRRIQNIEDLVGITQPKH